MLLVRLLAAALTLASFAQAEFITLVATNRASNSSQPSYSETITLAAGELATAAYISNYALIDVTIENILVRIDANNPEQTNIPVIAGPATIRIANLTNINAALATFKVQRSIPTAAVPAQAVVIPDDGSGDREVSLESSSDLVTWTATIPGIFQSSNSARFFRVRVAKTE